MSNQPKTHWEVEDLENGTRVVVADPAAVVVEGKRYRFRRVPAGHVVMPPEVLECIGQNILVLYNIGIKAWDAMARQGFRSPGDGKTQPCCYDFPMAYVDKLIAIGTELKRLKGDQP